jgi:hypothetical protein
MHEIARNTLAVPSVYSTSRKDEIDFWVIPYPSPAAFESLRAREVEKHGEKVLLKLVQICRLRGGFEGMVRLGEYPQP